MALLVYWFNILLLGVTLPWSWRYATRARLLADDLPGVIHPAVVRRIVIAQSLYAAGAALCFINTYWSIAAIVLVQVNYAIAPRFCWGLFSRKDVAPDQITRELVTFESPLCFGRNSPKLLLADRMPTVRVKGSAHPVINQPQPDLLPY